ncbi:uncharacterized protein LOC121293703 isoform X3 [Carcharodon carcharias]|uniref:uncharacterized protein LOC121293703 isoform X3 n=1 Tax=Carcharodon carcharias TaxID=13397 RepID=UPI001B7F036E|nr:uncharacterized protein LOC121293703 isoform X3 [Carcharodon carcharias]
MAEEQCRFLHRESCKSSQDVCQVWHEQNGCKNYSCPQKHLNRETLKRYFLCDQENLNDCCKRANCHWYHEKVSNVDGFYRSANEVPVLAEERRRTTQLLQSMCTILFMHADAHNEGWTMRIERNNFMEKNFTGTQISLKSASQFIKIAVKFIQCAVRDRKLSGDRGKQYIKEILHTILFFCQINDPDFEPKDILEESLELWSCKLPDVFEQYKTHLPTRPPYTILLEIVVDYEESDNTERILDLLSKLNKNMTVEQNSQEGSRCGNGLCFVSRVISCCFFQDLDSNTKTDNYFGASVSCFGKHQKELMIDILCYHTWNEDISLAVCMALEGHPRALVLRPQVHSIAYPMRDNLNRPREVHIANGKHQLHTPIPPCRKCLDLFPDIGNDLQQRNNVHQFWSYGNCAEVESLNRLLNAHGDISRREAAPPGDKFTLESLKNKRKGRIVHNLKLFKFHLGNKLLFYRPSELQNKA